jgi:hypothetical protein
MRGRWRLERRKEGRLDYPKLQKKMQFWGGRNEGRGEGRKRTNRGESPPLIIIKNIKKYGEGVKVGGGEGDEE